MGLIFRILPFMGLIALIPAEQVILLDTTGEGSLDWTRFPYGPQANTPGWVEESFTNFEKGINWRSYVVCDVAYNNVNNWLWTPFIDRGVANRIYIEIKFTIRDCSLFPGNALSCKETFSLLYYEFDAATREPPPWETESYKLIGRIAAGEGRFNTNSEVVINTEVKSIPVTKKGVYFAFRDQGACISLLAIKVYYITCPEVTINFAHFPATPTGREVTIIEQATGVCVDNAEVVDKPNYLCKGDGKWTLPTGGCKCKPGYEPDFDKQTCNVCRPGTYKAGVGDSLCEPCPKHSKAPDYGFSECRCNAGWFRAPKDPKNMSCTQPPSAPQNLTLNFVDQSTVILSWNPPEKLGGRIDTIYKIQCDACSLGVTYTPNTETFNDTKVTISGLNAVTTYRFQVFAENGVSHIVNGTPEYSDIKVTTEASVPSSVSNVRVVSVKSTEISLAWDAPQNNDAESDLVESYEVRYFPSNDIDHTNATTLLTKELQITIVGLEQKTDYGLQVRAKTQHGWGEYSPVMFKTTGQVLGTTYVGGDEEGLKLRLVAGGIVAVVVLLVAIIILTVLFLRSRSNDECNKKQPSDCDTLEYRNGEVHHSLDNPPIVTTKTNVTTPLFTGSSRTYIDPHTYEDPNQAVREFAREIDASCITIEAIIGGGEFGDVCRGKLKLPGSGLLQDIDVAIKTLKAGSLDKARNDFLTEASIMGQFEHPNVIFLQGVVTKSNPVMIITEYMENGSLDTFLRANDGKFQVLQLVGMLRGIASGMQYLSDMNYVHRDLAARNVLVNSQLVCKIADFGLSREIESTTEGAYTTRGGKIPVRWTAPEAIAFRKFTSASDVWSMGIVCWEVMSYGERPYWNWSNQDVIKSIEKGYRLPAPMDCPEAIYQLMLDCWQKERTHRPTFSSIVKTLDKLIRVPETLRKIAQNRRQPPLNPNFWQKTEYGLTPFQNMQDIPLSELSQMMSQIPLPLENFQQLNNGLPIYQQWQPNNSNNTLPRHLNRNNCNSNSDGLHFIHDPRTQKVYSIPESYLQSAVPSNHNQWSQNAYQRLQNELDLKHQVNNFLLTNQWAGDMSRGPQWSYLNSTNSNSNSNCSPRWSPSSNLNSISSHSHSHSGNSEQWYPNDNDENNEHTPDDKQKHSNGGAGAWVTFNQLSTNPLAADAPDLTSFTSVEEWLNSIKMARYLENFHSGGINNMDTVVNLTVKELTELGITLVGHQKKIMNSVQNIRAQIRVNGPEGFLV